jgi:hypothetical protein
MPEETRWEVTGHLLVFCGRYYPLWKCGDSWSWDGPEIADYLSGRRLRSDLLPYHLPPKDALADEPKNPKYSYYWRPKFPFSFHGISAFLAANTGIEIGESIHLEFKSPVVLVRCRKTWLDHNFSVVIDPSLKELGFVSKVDPFTTYQEIAMYLGNQLAQPDIAPQVVGDDETLARAKGFDEKSFRTQAPGSKKLNRKANRARKKGSQ